MKKALILIATITAVLISTPAFSSGTLSNKDTKKSASTLSNRPVNRCPANTTGCTFENMHSKIRGQLNGAAHSVNNNQGSRFNRVVKRVKAVKNFSNYCVECVRDAYKKSEHEITKEIIEAILNKRDY